LLQHDGLAILPDFDDPGVGQEDDRDKPPYAVDSGVFTQGWYLIQGHRGRTDMSLYVRLVTVQVEPISWQIRQGRLHPARKPVQSVRQTWHGAQVGGRGSQHSRSAFRQHLPNAFTLLEPSLSVLAHLPPKVIGIEYQTVKQEAGRDLRAARRALISAYPQQWLGAAAGASLECQRWVNNLPACLASAATFALHR